MTDTTIADEKPPPNDPRPPCAECLSGVHPAGYHDNTPDSQPAGYHDNSVD
jgi:hypothetical protein